MGILIIVCYMLAQFVCAPFWDKRVNALDCACYTMHCVARLCCNNAELVQRGDGVMLVCKLRIERGSEIYADYGSDAATAIAMGETVKRP